MAIDPEKRRASQAAYYKRHAEQCRARSKAYKAAHVEEVRACMKRYRAEQRTKLKPQKDAYNKAYYAARREIAIAYSQERYTKNKTSILKKAKVYHADRMARLPHVVRAQRQKATVRWRSKHPEKVCEFSSKRRALKRMTRVEPVDFAKILRDANGICAICRNPFDLFGVHFDHIVPLSKGGAHTTDNLQATHARCNLAKGAKVG